MNDVHALLERAVAPAGHPAVSTETVYARAARVRSGRRAAVSAAALAVVATGAVTLPGFVGDAETEPLPVAAAPAQPAEGGEKAERLSTLLPSEVGEVRYSGGSVLMLPGRPFKPGTEGGVAVHWATDDTGPLDGAYAVPEGGSITLHTVDAEFVADKLGPDASGPGLCARQEREQSVTDCVSEELPGGEVLTTWSTPQDRRHEGTQQRAATGGRLLLKDGAMLVAGSTARHTGDASEEVPDTSPPLSREQLRTFLLRPELLPEK
ncbi:hypothetical protein [Streptomyces atroolivaceus]|uniref:hypothetical protein n=1 Tax=Streptomyces atroolivaceus TaxID=66869 RepID=UPI0036B4443E